MSDQLSPPGSSSYSSSTMHVGDGTWDATRDTFLLPNVQGLNFATMRYNGMGNRFKSLPEYHQLITAHGVIAAITFLGIVPAAILIAGHYHVNGRLALRLHISLQLLTVLLSTVILVLGYFAVGPERSLSNPHHGIGVAIYVLVLVQVIGGSIIHRIEKGKRRYYIPVKLMLHEWFGRAIALLAIAQIPIGLTLYGSPEFLFILYTLVMAAYVVLYFVLSFRQKRRAGLALAEGSSYYSRTEVTEGRSESRHHPGRWLLGAIGAGGAIEALRRRRSDRDRRTDATGSAVESRPDSASYLTEKYSDDSRDSRNHTWRNRLLGAGAGLGAVAAAKKFFNRGQDRDRHTDYDSELSQDRYRPQPAPPLGGHVSQSTAHLDMVESGMPASQMNPGYRSMGPGPSPYSQGPSQGPPPLSGPDVEAGMGPPGAARDNRPPRPAEDSVITPSSQLSRGSEPQGPFSRLAEFTGISGFMRRRRSKREQQRIDAERQRDYENERMFGRQEEEPLYPGDGTPRRDGVRFDPRSASGPDAGPRSGQPPIAPVPAPNFAKQPGYGYGDENPSPPIAPVPAPNFAKQPGYGYGDESPSPPRQNLPPPPRGPAPTSRGVRGGPQPSNSFETTQRGPPMSNTINNTINNNLPRSAPPTDNALQPPPAVASPGRNNRTGSDTSNGNVGSPPISLKLQMHNDRGGHVTLRRLNDEEAAAQRDATGRASSADRRAGMRGTPPAGQQPIDLHMPSAPQRGAYTGSPSAAPPGPIGSPSGTAGYDTGTDSYDTNRRRRRAERARAEQARRGGRDSSSVDFT